MRHQGVITRWNDDKGFGFITPKDGGAQVFVHIKAFTSRQQRPTGGETVIFELKTDAKGRIQADNVAFKDQRIPPGTTSVRSRSNASLVFVVAFMAFVAIAVVSHKLPFPIFGLYLVASVVAFTAYAVDKSAAKKDRWRTQESTLHLLALVGGWPGGLLAQRLLRHKSKKQSFLVTFWITVIVNCGVLGWLFLPQGSQMLHSVLDTPQASIRWEKR